MSEKMRIPTVLTVGSLILFVGAGVLLATGLSQADDPKASQTIPPPWEQPEPTEVPRPKEDQAKSIAAAKQDLAKDADLAAILNSAESGAVDTLMDLAKRSENYCEQGRKLPPECSSEGDEVNAVFIDSGEITPRAVETVKSWIGKLLSNGGSSLEFASRDSRFPEGKGGKYYLVFRAPEVVDLGDGYRVNALRVVVTPGSDTPIDWIGFMGSSGNGLQWVQDVDNSESAPYQLLIAPESVENWPVIGGPGRQR
jgi:hypothetical protein